MHVSIIDHAEVSIGTLAGMLGTGRVIALFNRQFGSYLIPLGKPSSNHP